MKIDEAWEIMLFVVGLFLRVRARARGVEKKSNGPLRQKTKPRIQILFTMLFIKCSFFNNF